jgi:hypothetical protein
MKIIAAVAFVALAGTTHLAAQPLPEDCAKDSVEAVQKRADAGEAKAQYLRGYQMIVGKCGKKEEEAGAALMAKSAAQYYPPALHMIGIADRSAGRYADAIAMFFGAAQRGLRAAEVDLGLTHAEIGTPVRNDAVAHAWLSLAVKRNPALGVKKFLEGQIAVLDARMNAEQKKKASDVLEALIKKSEPIPAFSDEPGSPQKK